MKDSELSPRLPAHISLVSLVPEITGSKDDNKFKTKVVGEIQASIVTNKF